METAPVPVAGSMRTNETTFAIASSNQSGPVLDESLSKRAAPAVSCWRCSQPLETGRGGGRAPLASVQCHFPHLALCSTILPADFPSATDA